MQWKQKAGPAINLVGSLASITGVTALWLTQLKPNLNWLLVLPIVVVAASTFLAIAATIYVVGLLGYERISRPPQTNLVRPLKVAYGAFAVGAGTMLLTLFAYLLSGAAISLAQQALGL